MSDKGKVLRGWAIPALGLLCGACACVCGFIYESFPTPPIGTVMNDEFNHKNASFIDPGNLGYTDLRVGTGMVPEQGNMIITQYVGRFENGKEFDNSNNRNEPMRYKFGTKQVIKGFDMAVASMREGGKRRVWIPPELAYGDKGLNGEFPARTILVYDIELVRVESPTTSGFRCGVPYQKQEGEVLTK